MATTERSENSHVGVTNITGVKVLLTDTPVSSRPFYLPTKLLVAVYDQRQTCYKSASHKFLKVSEASFNA